MAEPCPMCRYARDAKASASWTLSAASYCPSLNRVGVNGKNNNAYRWWRNQWAKLLKDQVGAVPPAAAKRRVTITRHYGTKQRAYDRINYAAGCKALLDVLVGYGVLYDDSELWCEDHYRQVKSVDGVDRVTVLVEELA